MKRLFTLLLLAFIVGCNDKETEIANVYPIVQISDASSYNENDTAYDGRVSAWDSSLNEWKPIRMYHIDEAFLKKIDTAYDGIKYYWDTVNYVFPVLRPVTRRIEMNSIYYTMVTGQSPGYGTSEFEIDTITGLELPFFIKDFTYIDDDTIAYDIHGEQYNPKNGMSPSDYFSKPDSTYEKRLDSIRAYLNQKGYFKTKQ